MTYVFWFLRLFWNHLRNFKQLVLEDYYRARIQFRFGKPGCQSQGDPVVSDDATQNRVAPKIDLVTQDDVIWWRKMCHWDSMIFEELVPHLNRCPKICSLLFTFVHFFVLKELVPRLNRHPKIGSLLFTFIFSKISKGAVPRLNSSSHFCSFSVHFVASIW